MKSSAVGLHPLPVELWEEIFAIATDVNNYWAKIAGDWCSVQYPFFSSEEEEFVRTPPAKLDKELLRTRYSIILVCKSWYFMGIPLLWSHLQFDEMHPRNFAMMIYGAIKRNPTLAPQVIRLTIESICFRREDSLKMEKIHLVAKFAPLLTNLKAISCSLPYAARLQPLIQPGIVVLNNSVVTGLCSTSGMIGPLRTLLHNSLWVHCHTLSLRLVEGLWDRWDHPGSNTLQPTFEILLNLKLEVSHTAAMQWIEEYWKFPVLKNLSLIFTGYIDRISFLQRVRLTLEKLQICVGHVYRYNGGIIDVEMPKLKEISLINMNGTYVGPSGDWYTAIKAPHLSRFGISLRSGLGKWDRTHEVLTEHMESVLGYFPSVRKVIIIAPMGEWVRPSSNTRKDRVILRMKDVVRWCQRGVMEVEIVSGSKAERRTCTQGLSSTFDKKETLEYYRYRRVGPHLPNFARQED
jgi:hypothetical protein